MNLYSQIVDLYRTNAEWNYYDADLVIRSQRYEDYEFSYLWFLVCLFHDMGYAVENDWTYKCTYRKNSEEYLQEHKDIKGSWIGRYIV